MEPAGIAACQPISFRRKRSGGSAARETGLPASAKMGCAVPRKASQIACLIRPRFGVPAFGHR